MIITKAPSIAAPTTLMTVGALPTWISTKPDLPRAAFWGALGAVALGVLTPFSWKTGAILGGVYGAFVR